MEAKNIQCHDSFIAELMESLEKKGEKIDVQYLCSAPKAPQSLANVRNLNETDGCNNSANV